MNDEGGMTGDNSDLSDLEFNLSNMPFSDNSLRSSDLFINPTLDRLEVYNEDNNRSFSSRAIESADGGFDIPSIINEFSYLLYCIEYNHVELMFDQPQPLPQPLVQTVNKQQPQQVILQKKQNVDPIITTSISVIPIQIFPYQQAFLHQQQVQQQIIENQQQSNQQINLPPPPPPPLPPAPQLVFPVQQSPSKHRRSKSYLSPAAKYSHTRSKSDNNFALSMANRKKGLNQQQYSTLASPKGNGSSGSDSYYNEGKRIYYCSKCHQCKRGHICPFQLMRKIIVYSQMKSTETQVDLSITTIPHSLSDYEINHKNSKILFPRPYNSVCEEKENNSEECGRRYNTRSIDNDNDKLNI